MELVQNELITIGLLFLCAIVGSLLAKRFKQPGVVIMLGLGALIGPNFLGFIKSQELINMSIDFGAIFLLFAIGLEFNMLRLRKFWLKAAFTAMLKVLIIFFLAFEASMFIFGLSPLASLAIGIVLSFSSTVIMVNVLEQKKMLQKDEVPLLVAVLVVEDVLAVFVITVISAMKASSASFITSLTHIMVALVCLVGIYLVALLVLKPLVKWLIAHSEKDEIIMFFAFTLCAGMSYLSHAMGLSGLTGAFMAGSLVATLPNRKTFEGYLRPYKVMFSSLFFLAIGMLVNLKSLAAYPLLIPFLLIIVFLSRMIAMGFASYSFVNMKGENIVFSSIALSCVGEFSLLIAGQARGLDIGLDLVTICTVIIIASAIFMSSAIDSTHKVHSSFRSAIPSRAKSRIERFSFYMNSLFEQLETESAYTKRFKRETTAFLLLWPCLLLVLFVETKAVAMLGGKLALLRYLLYVMAFLMFAFIMLLAVMRLKKMYKNLLVIVSNMTYSTNLRKSRLVIKTFARAMLFITLGLLSPVAIFSMGLPPTMHLVAFALIVFGIVHLWWAMGLVNSVPVNGTFSMPTYKKVKVGEWNVEPYD